MRQPENAAMPSVKSALYAGDHRLRIRLLDKDGRLVRLTAERPEHLESDHPEMRGQLDKIERTLREPERVIRSRSDLQVGLYYRLYAATPVTRKHLCVVAKSASKEDAFVVTAYFTNTPKQGDVAMGDRIRIWYDREADYLEVPFDTREGYLQETENDAAMEKIDKNGDIVEWHEDKR